jgi:uncharacterized protein (TIGR02246 family)
MRSRALFTTLSILVVASLLCCAPPTEQPLAVESPAAVDLAAEEQTIRDSSMQWLAAEQGRDLLTALSFLDPNVTTIFDGEVLRGRAAVESATQARWEANPDATIDWVTNSVAVSASADLAYELGSWTTDLDGPGDADAESGEYVTVWQKTDGEWRVAVDAGSTVEQSEDR